MFGRFSDHYSSSLIQKVLTSRIRSPTFAAFSFITLVQTTQYRYQQQIRQKLTDQSSLSSGRAIPLLNEDYSALYQPEDQMQH